MTNQKPARIFRAALVLSLAPLWAACGGAEASGPAWGGTVSDSAGVRVINNPAEGLWTEQTGWSLTEELSIGGISGDVEYEFGRVTGIDVDAAGNLYVADVLAQEIRVFDAQGVYVQTIGKPGQGPGEIGPGGLVGVFVLGDEVIIPDMANARLNRYTLEGEDLEATRMDILSGLPLRWDRIANGLVAQLRTIDTNQNSETELEPTGDVIVTMSREARDTLATLPIGKAVQITGGAPEILMFGAEPIWDAADDGTLIYGVNSEVRIEVWGPDGTLRHVVARDFEPKPVGDSDKQAMRDAVMEQVIAAGAPPAAVAPFIESMKFADRFPAFSTLATGPQGSVWAQRIRTPGELDDGETLDVQDLGSNDWDVYNSDGHYLGVFTFPGKFQPIKVIGDLFYGVHRDELDVPSVKVYRIIPGPVATE
jgi:hypothetical protein